MFKATMRMLTSFCHGLTGLSKDSEPAGPYEQSLAGRSHTWCMHQSSRPNGATFERLLISVIVVRVHLAGYSATPASNLYASTKPLSAIHHRASTAICLQR
jgi:hypothetical protein